MNFRQVKTWALAILLTGLCISKVMAQVADPVLAVAGVNNSAQTITVKISDSTTGGTIRYTTNGSTPTSTSTIITSGSTLNLNQSNTLKVLVFSGSQTSNLLTAQYTNLGLISSSGDHTVVLNKDGTVSSFGNGTSGQLGGGSATSSNLPIQTQISSGTPFTGANPARGLVSTTQLPAQLAVTSGLTAWFKADAGVMTTGTSVTQWNDQSGNQFNVAQSTTSNEPTQSTDPASGRPVVSFNGSQLLTANVQLPVNDVTIIVVGSSTNPTASYVANTVVCIGGGIDSGQTRAYEDSYVTTGPNYLGQGFNNGTNPVNGGPLVPDSLLNIGTVTYAQATGAVSFYQQGMANGSTTITSSSTVNPGLTLGSLLGGGPFCPWNGNIAEVIIYNRVLSPTERQQVELYLASKYGVYAPGAAWINLYTPAVQAEINRNLWNRNQADAYVAFQNANAGMLTNGLKLWLRADAGVTTSIGSYVNGWADQTGNYPLSQNQFYGQPTLVTNDSNGEPALRFSGSQSLTNPSGIGINTDMTIITVGMTTAPSAFQYSLYLGNETTGETRAIGYNNSAEYFDTTGGTGSTAPGAAAPAQNFFVIEAASLNPALNSVTFYRNGTQTGTGTLSGVLSTSAGIAVGSSGQANTYWQGDISEVLVYDHQLSSNELQQVNLYLANKYGLYFSGASWISSYTSAVQTQINANQWNKVQADKYVQVAGILPVTSGLTAWFKADSGVKTNGSTQVEAWADSSWNNNDVSQSTASSAPTVGTDLGTGTPTVNFSAGQTLSNGNSYPAVTNNTIIAVAATPSPAALAFTPLVTYGNPVNNGNVSGLAYNWTNLGSTYTAHETVWEGSFYYINGGALPSTSALMTTALSYSSSAHTVSFYLNGAANQTVSTSEGSFTNGLSLGSAHWPGNISEVLVYNRALSSTEIGQIQTYLAAKYPSNPAPTISASGTNATTPRTVTLSGATSPAVICYTLDGTIPTASSTQYTTPFTLTQDGAFVKCAIFNSGVQISQMASTQVWVGDTSGIGITDAWQHTYFPSGPFPINPSALSPGGLTYLQAFQWGYNPTMFSTNGDGLSDLVNHQLGYAGSNTDINGYTDGSGNPMTNAQQLALGLDPFDVGVNPAQPAPPTPNPNDHTPPPLNLTQPANAQLQ